MGRQEFQGTLTYNGSRWELDNAQMKYEFHCGDSFDIEINGNWKTTRIEFDHKLNEFYSVEGIPLKQGVRIRVFFNY
jgi:hypothetical protein